MRRVPLTQGKTALVDARDWERVRVHAWRLARQRAGGRQYLYAVTTIGGKRVELGRFVLGSRAGRRVRHKNGNALDCRRANLTTKQRRMPMVKGDRRYQELLAEQGGGCAICGLPEVDNGRRLSIDRTPDRQAVRGLLCQTCALALGQFNHDPELLRAAAAYLEALYTPRK